MDDVRQELATLRALVGQQQRQIDQLKAGLCVREDPGQAESATRRQMLIGAAAAVMGGAAAGMASPAEAATGDFIKLGVTSNTASAPTGTEYLGSPSQFGYCLGATDNGLSQFPYSATIAGHTQGGFSFAVLGFDEGSGLTAGVAGVSRHGVGVGGVSELGHTGVAGRAPNGTGVRATGQVAVQAEGTYRGVDASVSGSGPKTIAVSAIARRAAGGSAFPTALAVSGVHRASRAGRAIVPAGKKSVRVAISPLTTTSLVLATPQKVSGTLAVAGVSVSTAAPTSFVVALTGPAPAGGLPVAWFVVDMIGTALS